MMEMLPVSVRSGVLDTMRRQARLEFPLECCGLLSGRDGLIDEAVPTTNQEYSPVAFSIAPADLIAFFKELRRRSRQFLGMYHSHPRGRLEPSKRDVADFHYREVSYWIIAGSGSGRIGCYRWEDEGFVPSAYRVIEPAEE